MWFSLPFTWPTLTIYFRLHHFPGGSMPQQIAHWTSKQHFPWKAFLDRTDHRLANLLLPFAFSNYMVSQQAPCKAPVSFITILASNYYCHYLFYVCFPTGPGEEQGRPCFLLDSQPRVFRKSSITIYWLEMTGWQVYTGWHGVEPATSVGMTSETDEDTLFSAASILCLFLCS